MDTDNDLGNLISANSSNLFAMIIRVTFLKRPQSSGCSKFLIATQRNITFFHTINSAKSSEFLACT